jgi:hypothetical protein
MEQIFSLIIALLIMLLVASPYLLIVGLQLWVIRCVLRWFLGIKSTKYQQWDPTRIYTSNPPPPIARKLGETPLFKD